MTPSDRGGFHTGSRFRAPLVALIALGIGLGLSAPAYAGKMGALEGLIRAVVEESRADMKTAAKGVQDTRWLRGGEELFEAAAHRHESLLRAAGRATDLDEKAIAGRLARFTARADSETVQALATMSAAERHFVVESAETAGELCRKYPVEATAMIRQLGPEGLSYVRVFGDDVAETVLKEGPESLGVLRKGGRGAWSFFKEHVLPNKGKLAAAGVLAAFLANPDEFVDIAGRATDYAVREFARAGVELASEAPGAFVSGLDSGVTSVLDRWGLNYSPVRWTAVTLLVLLAAGAALRLFGWPLRAIAWPVTFALRQLRRSE